MGKSSKKGSWTILKEGFKTLKRLDNTNVYGVIVSECVSNIFKEGMWQKVLGPYTLFLSDHDKLLVGNTITLNSTTRAVVGVVTGRWLINRLGVDTCFGITGVIGIIGICVNFFSLLQGSIPAVVLLNVVWGVYTGLWNACIEVEWAHSLLANYREDASSTRQVLNKLTSAAGPLCSLIIFQCFGNSWDLTLIVTVMLTGTTFTILSVMLCFRFDRIYEIRQEIYLCDVRMIQFSSTILVPSELRRASFVPMEDGPIRLSYPLKVTSKYEKLRIFTPDLRETQFILGKQFRAWFKDVPSHEPVGIVYFWDPSREPVRADLESYSVFLRKDGSLNTEYSQLTLHLYPDLRWKPSRPGDVVRRLLLGRGRTLSELEARELGQSLLNAGTSEAPAPSRWQSDSGSKKAKKVYEPNITKANMLVCCDVLNAVGSGMSLKFIDLFLIEECFFSPSAVLIVAIIQNVFSATLTPVAKQTMNWVRDRGFKSAFGVVVIWALGCFFMGLLCIPGMPQPIVVASIVMMNSLFSCTKAYNRARLINALPHHRVANYMIWDSLNKANQGGVALMGAQLVAYGGYRTCFRVTLVIFGLRWLIYAGYSLKKGVRRKKVEVASPKGESFTLEMGSASPVATAQVDHDDEDYSEAHLDEGSLGHGPDAADSELFPSRVEELPENELLVVEEEDVTTREPTNESESGLVF